MSRRMFSLSEIIHLDLGKIDSRLRTELKRAVLDVTERPEVDKPRVVALEMRIMPDQYLQGQVETVFVEFVTKSKLPPASAAYSMHVQASGQLTFNDESPDEPHQGTLDELGQERA